MGLMRTLLALPVKGPLDGTLWVAGKIAEAAGQELNDPRTIRAELREAERRLLAGELDEDAYDEIETALLLRLKAAG